MFDECNNIGIDIMYCEANIVASKAELQLHIDAAIDSIRTDYYELYLYHKGYVRIYLNEVAEWEVKLQNYSQKLPTL